MAYIKATQAERTEGPSALLQREKSRLRSMQIMFTIFCIVLILLTVLSLLANA